MSSKFNNNFKKAGFTIVELMVVLGIFVTSMVALFGVARLSMTAIRKAGEKTQAAFLLEETYEGIRFMRDVDFSDKIEDLSIYYDHCFRFNGSDSYSFFQDSNILLLHMDETAGNIMDSSGKGHNGAPSNIDYAPQGNGSSPNLQGALGFNGLDSVIQISDHPDFDLVDFTFSAWVRVPVAGAGSGVRILQNHINWVLGWQVGINASHQLTFYGLTDGITANAPHGDPLNDDQWHHVAIVRDTNDLKVKYYIDGDFVGEEVSGSNAAYTTAAPFRIGNNETLNSAPNATIDEVALYNRVLTEDEILLLYTLNRPVCGKLEDKYTRIVRVKNVCRDSDDTTGYKSNILGGYIVENDIQCRAATDNTDEQIDPDTKYFEVDVVWNGTPDRDASGAIIGVTEFKESLEFYVGNLFLDGSS